MYIAEISKEYAGERHKFFCGADSFIELLVFGLTGR
jgi:hypothetical protein